MLSFSFKSMDEDVCYVSVEYHKNQLYLLAAYLLCVNSFSVFRRKVFTYPDRHKGVTKVRTSQILCHEMFLSMLTHYIGK